MSTRDDTGPAGSTDASTPDAPLAFVTGAAGGIGSAIVHQLLGIGARVIATDVDTDGLAAVSAGASDPAEADRLRCEPLDVTREAEVDALVDRVESEWGPIEWGVNVAGVLAVGEVADSPLSDWERVMAVNATGVFLVSRALARVMKPRGRGALVTVGSNAGGVPRHGMALYAASKAASSQLTRSLALELAPHGIRCNVVAPGSTRTPMQTAFQGDSGGEATVLSGSLERFRPGIPLGRIADPDDVANAVLFLLSERARHITMAELYVDGGAALHP